MLLLNPTIDPRGPEPWPSAQLKPIVKSNSLENKALRVMLLEAMKLNSVSGNSGCRPFSMPHDTDQHLADPLSPPNDSCSDGLFVFREIRQVRHFF